MRFVLTIDGVDYPIEVSKGALEVNGRTFHVQADVRKVMVDGVEYQVEVGDGVVWVNGLPYAFSLGDGYEGTVQTLYEAVQNADDQPSAQPVIQSNHALTAIMPGRVLRVLVKEGDHVQAGEVLCVLEAMKMENELHAHAAGVVLRVLVKPGQTVEAGQSLILFEEVACDSSEV
ncbi:MAG: biotin/lipoyl-containing protein [Anaerolineae bacterium]